MPIERQYKRAVQPAGKTAAHQATEPAIGSEQAVDPTQLQHLHSPNGQMPRQPLPMSPEEVLQLQRLAGNQAVTRLIMGTDRAPIQRAPPAAVPAVQKGAAQKGVKAAPPPLAADELILSSDPKYTKQGYLTWFKDQVKANVKAWGFTFDAAKVELKQVTIGKTAKTVMLLHWDNAWGTRPVTTELPFTLEPVDAMLALNAVHKLKGWSKVPKDDQDRLDAMLGGETNELSAKAREHLKTVFHALSGKAEAEQAKTLCALLKQKEALPAVVDEKLAIGKVAYTLEGPAVKKDYEFRGRKADAEEYVAKYKDGTHVTIVAPKGPQKGFHNHTVNQTADAAGYLPKKARITLDLVVLNAVTNPDDPHWAAEYKQPNFHSYMTGGSAGQLTIYPDKTSKTLPDDNYMRGTMIHETGHIWSYKTWGTDKTKGKWAEWQKAIDKDKIAASGYAKNAIAEDVAETIQIYASTQGSPRNAEYRKMMPNRFAILDKEYK